MTARFERGWELVSWLVNRYMQRRLRSKASKRSAGPSIPVPFPCEVRAGFLGSTYAEGQRGAVDLVDVEEVHGEADAHGVHDGVDRAHFVEVHIVHCEECNRKRGGEMRWLGFW